MAKHPDLTVFAHNLPHTPYSPQHTHEFHEIFYCTGGSGRHHIRDWTFDTRPGDIFMLPGGLPHRCSAVTEEDKCGCIVLYAFEHMLTVREESSDAAKVLRELCALAENGTPQLRLSGEGQKKAGELLKSILDEFHQQQSGYGMAMSIRLQELLLLILRDSATAESLALDLKPPAGHERLTHALRFLQYNHQHAITVDQMAEMCCMSRSHFHAVFKQETGYTLVEYLNLLRVRTATGMLTDSDMPILEIAYACGYPSLSHFYHVFRRIMGRTPRQVRATGTAPNRLG